LGKVFGDNAIGGAIGVAITPPVLQCDLLNRGKNLDIFLSRSLPLQ